MKNKKNVVVGLHWQTQTSDNMGVCALAEAQIELLKRCANANGVRLTLIEFCPQGPNTNKKQIDDAFILAPPMSVKKILLGDRSYYNHIKRCDLILDIGQGDSFSDIYGVKRYVYLFISKMLAYIAGVPLIISPQTIGPFNNSIVRVTARYILNKSKWIFPRDEISYGILRDFGLKDKSTLVTDLAFALPYEQKPKYSSKKLRVGLNVSGLLFNGGYTGGNQFGLSLDYRILIDEIIKHLEANENVELHLIPHVISDTFEAEDDYRVSAELQKKFPKTILAHRFKNAVDAKSYISNMDFFMGGRMHACIAAFSSGVVTLPHAYSRKFNGLFGSLEYRHIIDLRNDTIESSLQKIEKSLKSRDKLQEEVEVANVRSKNLLLKYENYLSKFIGDLSVVAD